MNRLKGCCLSRKSGGSCQVGIVRRINGEVLGPDRRTSKECKESKGCEPKQRTDAQSDLLRAATHGDLELGVRFGTGDGGLEWSGATSLAEGNPQGGAGRWQPSITREMPSEPSPESVLFALILVSIALWLGIQSQLARYLESRLYPDSKTARRVSGTSKLL